MDVIPSTSSDLNLDAEISFRYSWQLKVSQRLLSSGEKAILNVSPSFCTAYNGVQFTWLLRLCDDFVLDLEDYEDENQNQRLVNATLYYKDGPSRDVSLCDGKISFYDADGHPHFSDLALEGLDYTKGAGWSPCCSSFARRSALHDFVHSQVGRQIKITVEMRFKLRWFEPFIYLPSLIGPNNQLQELCVEVLDQVADGRLQVPDVEFFDKTDDRFALHRHYFLFGCKTVKQLCNQVNADFSMEDIENMYAHLYFDKVIQQEAEFFEDYVEILIASPAVHFPALKKECERFICQEVMLESADLSFVKKMLILAERFDLKVLKMVSFGVLVDRIMTSSRCNDDKVDDIKAELLQFAEQIQNSEEDVTDAEDDCDNEGLVCSVVDQLEELAKHIKKVSMSPTESCPVIGIGPVTSPGPLSARRGRRSSLKTSRELLSFASDQMASPITAKRRRSVMFSLPCTFDETTMVSTPSNSCSTLSSSPEHFEHLPYEDYPQDIYLDSPTLALKPV